MGSDDTLVPQLRVHLPAAGASSPIAPFFRLLQQGVRVRRRVGCSVATFLREEIGAGPETIERIQSIFLDGKPVDDIDAALVPDGAALALSAALPGLVGATLRRGGAYSSFRSGITHHEQREPRASGTGWVTVRLFNLVMAELGPGLLREGVLVKAANLGDLLAELPPEIWPCLEAVAPDGRSVAAELLRDASWLAGTESVLLSVSPEPAGR